MHILPANNPADMTHVLRSYVLPWDITWKPITTGFSGARVWHGQSATDSYCLKAHPSTRLRSAELAAIHAWMACARNAGLSIVPHLQRTTTAETLVAHDAWTWELLEWLPGHADDATSPKESNVVAAVRALAEIHAVWGRLADPRPQPIPAIARRLAALQRWTNLVAQGWRPLVPQADPVAHMAERAWQLLPNYVAPAVAELTRWLAVEGMLQPCLCDVWYDHILFHADRVSGVIDYAAAKRDHPAVDLARLLGSLAPDPTRLGRALAAYAAVRHLPQPELVAVLERTGTIVAVTQWLTWLYHEQRHYPDRTLLAVRLQALVARLTSF